MRSAHIFSVIKVTLNSMKVLVLGPGGREHAIIRALLRDPEVTEVHSAPGDRKSTRLNSSHRLKHSFPTRRSSDLIA